MPDIAIALAAYSGSDFLAQQIESIREQTFIDWQLYARDDCSTDETSEVLENFASMDARIRICMGATSNLGAKDNFSFLIEQAAQSSCNYIALSDQDDIWMAEKLELQLKAMLMLESQFPASPILIHSDLEVVDAQLSPFAASFMAYQGVHHEAQDGLNVLLTQNFVTGCTILINRTLLDLALPIPEETLMHDWWLALCAAAFGHIGYVDQPLVKYRQHCSNEVGAQSVKSYLNPFRTNWWDHWLKGRKNFLQSMDQARILAERFKEHDPENSNLKLIESYALLPMLSPWQRIRVLKRNNIHCQSWLRHCLMLSRLLSLPRQIDG